MSDCMDEYHNFRDCVIREKKMFKSLVGDVDIKQNPQAIPEYLEKHFKQKEEQKRKQKMMGNQEEELKDRIQKAEEEASTV